MSRSSSSGNSGRNVTFGNNTMGDSSGVFHGYQSTTERNDAKNDARINRANQTMRHILYARTGREEAFTKEKPNTPESQQGYPDAMSGEEAVNTINNRRAVGRS